MIDEPAVRTEQLTKIYGDKIAVDSVDLVIPRGVAFGYLGPNGAGKTTLIRMLLGLTPLTSGKMWMLGMELPAERRQALAKVGAIVEEPRFHNYLTGLENLRIAGSVRGEAAFSRIEQSLERVGLRERGSDKVGSYSLGMRQRLGIARCLLNDPELLILDEPMNGLDPAGILEFRHLIRSFVDEGRTVVISSHLLDEIEKTCDAVAIVDKGHIVRQGSLEDMRGKASGRVSIEVIESELALSILSQLEFITSVKLVATGELEFELKNSANAWQANAALVTGGVSVERFEPAKPTLEDEFLAVTSNISIY